MPLELALREAAVATSLLSVPGEMQDMLLYWSLRDGH